MVHRLNLMFLNTLKLYIVLRKDYLHTLCKPCI